MTQINNVVLFTVFVIAVVSCNEMTIGQLPYQVGRELQGLLENNIAKQHLKPTCKIRVRSNAELVLYTRDNQDNAVVLNISDPKQFDPTKNLVVLIHGWLSGPNDTGILKMKDAYLKHYDCNVVIVDWSKVAKLPYSTSFCQVLSIAQYLAKALCYLKQHVNLSFDHVHVVGHSMGAHIAGWVGKYISTKCLGRIGRITGLDPSGPIFNAMPESRRLEKTDAVFVDVIHTDGDRFGSILKSGHSDFYPNCGQHQPGCSTVNTTTNDTLLSDVFCSHHRSIEYMAESINSNNYIAVSCAMCPRYCRAETFSETYTVMGEGCPQEPRIIKNLYIPTKSSAPYFQGWEPYSGVSHKFA